VKARIAELSAKFDQAIAKEVILSKLGVLQGITETIKEAREEKKFADAMWGYELLGKHYRLFDRAAESFGWNGDPSTLTEEQLEVLGAHLERIAFNGDQQKIAAARQRAAIEAGQSGPIVDTTSTPVVPEAEKELW